MRALPATGLLVLAAATLCCASALAADAPSAPPEAAASMPTTSDFDVARRLLFAPPAGHAVTYTTSPSPRVYMGLGPVFAALNASDRARPALLGALDLGTNGYSVQHVLPNASNSRYVFALSGTSLFVVDVGTPQSPTLAGSLSLSGLHYHMAQSGSYLYIAGDGKVSIVNVSNVTSPTLAGSFANTGATNRGIAVSGSYAYVAGSASFFVLNVSNPAAPSLAGSIAQSASGYGVALSGSYAYVAGYGSGLLVYNVSNPAVPTLAGSLPSVSYPCDVVVSGSYAYLPSWNSAFYVVDITNPAAPALTSTTGVTGFLTGVALGPAGTVFVANSSAGLNAMDVTTPGSPSLVGGYVAANARDVAVSGNYAYVAANYAGLVIIDLTVGRTVATFRSSYMATAVAVDGHYAYVGEAYRLEIVDIANPLSPVKLGSVSLPAYVNGVAAANGYAYLNVDDGSLRVVDVRNPAAPAVVGTLTGLGGTAGGIAFDGGLVYMARGSGGGLNIADVSVPATPTTVAKYAIGNVMDVSLDRRLAYLATREDGFDIVDVTTASNPLVTGSVYAWYPGSVAPRGDLLYGQAADGVHVYDVRDPGSPYELASYACSGFTRLRFANGDVFSAGTSGVIQLHYVGQCTDAYEPNDDNAHATPVTSGRLYQAGICDPRDADWYALGTPGAGHLDVTLEVPAGHQFRVQLFDQSGAPVAVSGPISAGEELVADLAPGKTYALQVFGVGGDYDAAHEYGLSYTFAPCAAPTQPVYIRSVTKDVNTNSVLEILDPNQPATVTGYDVWRSTTPGSGFTLRAQNVADMDQGVANVQYVDTTSTGSVYYYKANAYSSVCGTEGP